MQTTTDVLGNTTSTSSKSIGYSFGKNMAITTENNTLTIGTASEVSFDKVTVGNTTVTTDGVSVGNGPSLTSNGVDAGNLKITNVKAGEIAEGSTEAVTGGQLWTTNQAVIQNSDAINQLARNDARLNRRINDVGAQAAAIASLHPLPFDVDHRVSVSIGGGAYRGSGAAAVGLFVRPTENSLISLGGAVGNDDVMGNLSFSYRFGGDTLAQKPQQMAARLVSLDSENRDLSAQLAVARTRITTQDEKLAAQKTALATQDAKLSKTQAELDETKARLEKLEAAVRALTAGGKK